VLEFRFPILIQTCGLGNCNFFFFGMMWNCELGNAGELLVGIDKEPKGIDQ